MRLAQASDAVIAKTATFGGSASAVGGGLWAWVGTNAPQIGVVFGFVGMVVGIAGYYWLQKHKKIQIEIDVAKLQALKRDYNL